ncbi:MAG: MATE family efflux transporter [Oscillospiraceae bacterium]
MQHNLSEGSVLKKLIIFALPLFVSNMVQSFYNVADMLIVGRFSGAASMSGVNIGGQVTFILTNIIVGLCMGATVLIGQYVGSGDQESLKKVTSTIITVLLGVGVVVTVVMIFLRGPILRLIQTPAESYAESDAYLTVTLTGIIFIFGYNALSAILRGMGDSKHPFYFVLAACITNVVLDLLFVAVFKWGAFGAALATVIAQAMSMFLCVWFMRRNNFNFDFKFSSYRIDKKQLKLILEIGLPASIQNGITSFSFLFITAIVNVVGGMTASAAVGAVGKANSFAFMPAQAMSASISTMSAQNIGAGRLDRAVKACQIGTIFAAICTFLFFGFIQLFPTEVVTLFNDEPEVIAAGVQYIRSFAFDFLIVPFIFCINGMFIGGGHTMFTLITNVLSAVLLRVPACYFFGIVMGWGLFGVGLGAPIASAGALIVVICYLISGKWKVNRIGKSAAAVEV